MTRNIHVSFVSIFAIAFLFPVVGVAQNDAVYDLDADVDKLLSETSADKRRENASAQASPMPEEAPVITHVKPLIFILNTLTSRNPAHKTPDDALVQGPPARS